jgi:hypothetical protein
MGYFSGVDQLRVVLVDHDGATVDAARGIAPLGERIRGVEESGRGRRQRIVI